MAKLEEIMELVEKHFEDDVVMSIEDWDDILIEAQRRIDIKVRKNG